MSTTAKIVIAIVGFFIILGLILGYFIYRQNRNYAKENEKYGQAQNFEPVQGLYNNQQVSFYAFGESPTNINNLYVLVTGFSGDTPQKVAGQNDIFEFSKANPAYSDFWEVKYVTVPQNYRANSITSAEKLLTFNYPMKSSGKIVNQVQINRDSEISPNREKIECWAEGEKVYSWRFEENVHRDPNDQSKVLTKSLYVVVKKSDSDTAMVPGQPNIVETTPGEPDYTPLWEAVFVTVPADYQAGTIKSVNDIKANNYQTQKTGTFINCPVQDYPGKNTAEGQTAQQNQIKIQNFAFTPNRIEIPQNSAVTWVNLDQTQHSVTSDNNQFDSGALSPNQQFEFRFIEKGEFKYHCSFHNYMTGTVVVK